MTIVEIVTRLYASTLAIPGGHHGADSKEVKETVRLCFIIAEEIFRQDRERSNR